MCRKDCQIGRDFFTKRRSISQEFVCILFFKGVSDLSKGKFIVLEGVDGSGISTQASLLKNWLEENEGVYGRSLFTKEPTDGPVGSIIRLALSKRLNTLDEKVMALLFAADRVDHIYSREDNGQKAGILAALNKGYNVVSDRYYLSSYAYQSRMEDLVWLRQINVHALQPDLTIFLNVPVNESKKRRDKSRFHEELYEREDYLTEIRQNYLNIAQKLRDEGENIVIIDGARDKNKVFKDLIEIIKGLF